VELVDERRRGKRTDLVPIGAKSNRSSEATASIIGISHRKVERTRTILDYADEDTKQGVNKGDISPLSTPFLTRQDVYSEKVKEAVCIY
jgi:hypothetical protein